MVTPMVGNLTDDNSDGVIDGEDTPDVIFTAYENLNVSNSPGALVIVHGDDNLDGIISSTEESYYTTLTADDGTSYTPQSRGGAALGDIDSDGIPEICFSTLTAPLICIHADGDVVLVGDTAGFVAEDVNINEWSSGYPVIGDMDGDGLAEIAIGCVIWDSTGTVVGIGEGSHGGYVRNGINIWFTGISVMSDMDDDGELELVAGDYVYERDGSTMKGWPSTGADNGFSAVADLDNDVDGLPDVVTTSDGTAYIMDSNGTVWDSFPLLDCDGSIGTCGPPTIADFDSDGEPEIGIAGNTSYTVYKYDGLDWVPLWSESIYDASGATGAAVFDFEADGEAEVVFADEVRLYIWGGSDGADRLQGLTGFDHVSGTSSENPSLAEIDGSTKIFLASNEFTSSGWFGVRSIGSGAGPAWAPSRPVWNQHTYHITNVNDDLSIPTSESPNWETYNNFRTQDQGERPGSWQPDLTISAVEFCVDCDNGESTFYVVVENQGLGASGPVDMVISADSNTLVTESVDLNPQESTVLGPYAIRNVDWIGTLRVDIDPADDVLECDEYNNDQFIGLLPCEDRAG